jgi:hypothetical protein
LPSPSEGSPGTSDLERLFNQIVSNLSRTDSSQLRRPIPLAELRDSIVPYRACRRTLQLETSEDYELALMRLCAGEGGFARTEPADIGKAFAEEIRSPNPDLELIQRHEKASITLDPRALDEALSRDPHQAFVPRSPAKAKRATPRRSDKPVQVASPSAPTRCGRCRGELPVGRVVNFCPQCGYDQSRGHCPQCNAELEPEWRHCVSCGQALSKR